VLCAKPLAASNTSRRDTAASACGVARACVDPTTYELSSVFHPDGTLRGSNWPTVAHAAQWGHLDPYVRGCPIPEVIRNTRAWAHEVSAGRREVAASAYAYLLKQYKYADNDPRLIGALLEAVHNYFSAT